ncbi:MAG: hypothetical protein PHY08_12765 [Candidatus Cloacimonetes bacterium]|nr:hypothetical protein [Candidatus Cloacimonadota bacterium]
MKVVCISNYIYDNLMDWEHNLHITIGNQYNIEPMPYPFVNYRLIDDNGSRIICPICCFIPVEEYRNKRLKEIGI